MLPERRDRSNDPSVPHDTLWGYIGYRCSCEECRKCIRDYRRQQRDEHLAKTNPKRLAQVQRARALREASLELIQQYRPELLGDDDNEGSYGDRRAAEAYLRRHGRQDGSR